jgi:hypothetical protein
VVLANRVKKVGLYGSGVLIFVKNSIKRKAFFAGIPVRNAEK